MAEHKHNESQVHIKKKKKKKKNPKQKHRRAQCTKLWGLRFTVHRVLWVICQQVRAYTMHLQGRRFFKMIFSVKETRSPLNSSVRFFTKLSTPHPWVLHMCLLGTISWYLKPSKAVVSDKDIRGKYSVTKWNSYPCIMTQCWHMILVISLPFTSFVMAKCQVTLTHYLKNTPNVF